MRRIFVIMCVCICEVCFGVHPSHSDSVCLAHLGITLRSIAPPCSSICVCVYVCVRACALCVCVCACVCVSVCVCIIMETHYEVTSDIQVEATS